MGNRRTIQDEISQIYEVSKNTIKSRLNYGRKKIYEKVEELKRQGRPVFGIAPIPFLVWTLIQEEAKTQIPHNVLPLIIEALKSTGQILSTVAKDVAIKIPVTEMQAEKQVVKTVVESSTKKKVKWSSSNKKIATVSSKGKVTAKKAGTAYIYAKVSGKTLKCKVKVESPTISPEFKTIYRDSTYKLKV